MTAVRPAAALLPLLLLAAAAVGARADWSDCSSGPAAFKVSDVTLEPQPVKPGDVAQFAINAESAKGVAAGTVSMMVYYAGMPIWTQVDDLCQKTDCPIKPGPVVVRYTQPFPIITPPGSYTLNLRGQAGGEDLFCVKVNFQVVPPQADHAAAVWGSAVKGAAQQVLHAHRKALK